MSVESYLKIHAESLVKELGVESASRLTGKSKATLGRYYSQSPEHADRFMPIDVVARLEAAARFPHVTSALADLRGLTISRCDARAEAARGGVTGDMIALSRGFAMLMAEYHRAVSDGALSAHDAKRLLQETLGLQRLLVDMRLNLEKTAV